MKTSGRSTLALLLGILVFPTLTAASATENFSQTHRLPARGTVSLSNQNGNVEIEGWDREEVAIEAVKSARSQEDLDRMKIVIDARADHVSIKTEHEKKSMWFKSPRGEVHYKLKVPRAASLKKIDVVNARIEVNGVTGAMDLDSVNGSIVANGVSSTGSFDTVNGSINVTYATLSGVEKVRLDTVNGSCTVTLPAAAAFTLAADSVNGRVSCDFPITLESSGRRHLTGSVNGGGTRIVLDSVNGGLRIRKS